MLDAELLTFLRTYLLANLAPRIPGLTMPQVKQDFQPTQQGRGNGPELRVHFIVTKRHGQRKSESTWDAGAGQMITREKQQLETQLQVTAWRPFDAATPDDALTSGDLARAAAMCLTSDTFIAALQPLNAGVLKIGEVVATYPENDQDQFELVSQFTVTITHSQIFETDVPVAASTAVNIQRV